MIEPVNSEVEQALRLNKLYLELSDDSRAFLLREAERLALLESVPMQDEQGRIIRFTKRP